MAFGSLASKSWLSGLRLRWQKNHLASDEFSFLFEEPPPDEYISLDCETTGLNVRTDDIISIGAVRIHGKRILSSQRFEVLVQPQGTVSAESIRVHRLREADVACGIPVDIAMLQLLRFIGSRPLVGYFLEFDAAMINRAMKPLIGIKLPNRQIEVSAMYYDYKFKRLPSYKQHDNADIDLRFDTLMDDLQLPRRDAHDALNDAVMAALAFIKLKELGQS